MYEKLKRSWEELKRSWEEFKRSWREGWQSFGESIKLTRTVFNRYWLIWVINIFIFIRIMYWVRTIDDRPSVTLLVGLLIYAVSPLTFLLWLPYYLKRRKPHLYRGFIRAIGEWVGTPYPWKNRL